MALASTRSALWPQGQLVNGPQGGIPMRPAGPARGPWPPRRSFGTSGNTGRPPGTRGSRRASCRRRAAAAGDELTSSHGLRAWSTRRPGVTRQSRRGYGSGSATGMASVGAASGVTVSQHAGTRRRGTHGRRDSGRPRRRASGRERIKSTWPRCTLTDGKRW